MNFLLSISLPFPADSPFPAKSLAATNHSPHHPRRLTPDFPAPLSCRSPHSIRRLTSPMSTFGHFYLNARIGPFQMTTVRPPIFGHFWPSPRLAPHLSCIRKLTYLASHLSGCRHTTILHLQNPKRCSACLWSRTKSHL